MPCTMNYFKANLLALDQGINTLFGGWPDVSISSRSYRWRVKGQRKWPEKVINTLFFWDRNEKIDKRHCELSIDSKRERIHPPPEANPSASKRRKNNAGNH